MTAIGVLLLGVLSLPFLLGRLVESSERVAPATRPSSSSVVAAAGKEPLDPTNAPELPSGCDPIQELIGAIREDARPELIATGRCLRHFETQRRILLDVRTDEQRVVARTERWVVVEAPSSTPENENRKVELRYVKDEGSWKLENARILPTLR